MLRNHRFFKMISILAFILVVANSVSVVVRARSNEIGSDHSGSLAAALPTTALESEFIVLPESPVLELVQNQASPAEEDTEGETIESPFELSGGEDAALIPCTGEGGQVYLPCIFGAEEDVRPQTTPASQTRRVNAPFFEGDVRYAETAVFWFGKVNRDDNFTDVRIGYNQEHLFVNLSIYDRLLWYDTSPSPQDFDRWDSIQLYLNLAGNGTASPQSLYRFDVMLRWWEERALFQAAYTYNGTGWVLAELPFTGSSGWRGNAPNDNSGDDRGWTATFRIPFTSLGLGSPPAEGALWQLGVRVFDRDTADNAQVLVKTWPEDFTGDVSGGWGELFFGQPVFTPPAVGQTNQIMIRHLLNGAYVPGGEVGGGTICGDGLSFWSQWGDTSYPGSEDNSAFNIQNQNDIADWPCFARYYLTFPLEQVPPGKKLVSARLVLHLMGNSGGGDWGEPDPSYIQVFTVSEDWDENTVTWNNGPLAQENVAGTWVDPVLVFPGWPGVPYEWDLSRAAAQAYAAGEPLRLALYSADSQYHSGKYFISSYTGDWNRTARPTLLVEWGE